MPGFAIDGTGISTQLVAIQGNVVRGMAAQGNVIYTKPIVSSTWNASDASSSGFTLSNGNLTIQATAGGWRSARGTTGHSSGKVYVELAVSTISDGSNVMLGLADGVSFNTGSYPGSSNYSVSVQPSQGGYNSTGFTLHYGINAQAAAGDVWALAVDFAAGNAWMAVNNVWAASGNPATGSLPTITFVLATTGALFPVIGLNGASSGIWTLQPIATAQKYTPPSGFGAWDS